MPSLTALASEVGGPFRPSVLADGDLRWHELGGDCAADFRSSRCGWRPRANGDVSAHCGWHSIGCRTRRSGLP